MLPGIIIVKRSAVMRLPSLEKKKKRKKNGIPPLKMVTADET